MVVYKKCIASLCRVLLVMGLFVFSAHAGQGGKNGPAAFSDFDVDENGQVSEEEFNTLRAERMAARAAAGKQMRGAASAPSFADVDVDANGYIDPEELTSAQQAHMAKVHETGNEMGHGHGKGYGQGYGKQQGKGQGHGNGCGHGHGASAGESPEPCRGMMAKMPKFADFDLDGNGTIDETEFNQAHAEQMSKMAAAGHQMKHAAHSPGFAGIDTDGDGVISEGEFAAHQAEHHKNMQKGKYPESS